VIRMQMLKTPAVFADPLPVTVPLEDRIWNFFPESPNKYGETMHVPIGMIDSIGASKFKGIESLGLFSLLSQGYMFSEVRKSLNALGAKFEEEFDYLSSFQNSNTRVLKGRGLVSFLYAYLPGNCGCHFELALSEGSRRFGVVYHRFLLGKELSRKIKCELQGIYFLVENKALEVRKKYEERFEKGLSLLKLRNLKDLVLKLTSGKKHEKVYDEEWNVLNHYLASQAIRLAVEYQRKVEPVMDSILRMLVGEAREEDYKKIYRSFSPEIYD